MITNSSPGSPSLNNLLLFFSKFSIYLIGTSIIGAGILFLAGGALNENPVYFLLSVLIALSIVGWELSHYYNNHIKRIIIQATLSIMVFSILTTFCTYIYDKSWDGLSYHQLAIMEMNEGWNPVKELLPYEEYVSQHYEDKQIMNLWVNHYGKALEVFSAVLSGITGSIESGKVFNLLLLLATFCYAFIVLGYLPSLGLIWKSLLSLAISLNPIVVNQLFSYYLDGSLGALITLLILQFIILLFGNDREKKPALFTLFFLFVIIINLKFTGLVYSGWFGLSFLTLLLIIKNFQLLKAFILTGTLSVFFAIVIAGYNPYIINTFQFAHPFYPIAGKNKVDIIENNIPQELKGMNRIEKFLFSTYAASDNFNKENDPRKMMVKIPFTFSVKEASIFQSEGIRIGGFGVLWSGIFTLSLLLLIIMFINLRGKEKLYFSALGISILGSVAINPESWWARYVPQLWLIPVITALFYLAFYKSPLLSIVSKAILALMIFNSFIIGTIYFYSVFYTTYQARSELSRLHNENKPVKVFFDIFRPNKKKLEAYQIPYQEIKEFKKLDCDNPVKLLKMSYCQVENDSSTISSVSAVN